MLSALSMRNCICSHVQWWVKAKGRLN